LQKNRPSGGFFVSATETSLNTRTHKGDHGESKNCRPVIFRQNSATRETEQR